MPKSPSTPVNYMGLTKEEQYDYMRQNYPRYHKKMPKTPSTPVNYMGLTKEEQYEYVRQRDPKYHLKTPRNYSPINTSISNFANDSDKSSICSQNTNKDVIPTAIDGAPINTSKCLSELNDETVECLSLSETESVSFTITNLEQSKCIGEDKQLAEPQELPEYHQKPKEMDQGKTEENYIRELEMCQRELSTLKKENKELQHKFKEFLTQSKLLRDENEKLIQDTESQKEKCKEVLENLGQEAEKCEQYRTNIKSVTEQYESEIKALTGKLADETALALTLEEENKQLKTKLQKVTKEKSELVGQMSRTTGSTDLLEEKIENGFLNLTDLFLKEMSELRNQFEKSQGTTISTGILPAITNSEKQQLSPNGNSSSETQEQRTSTETLPTDQHSYNVFIAGDSVTSNLSRNKMSGTNLEVRIKSHSGGKLQHIHNTIIAMAEDDDEYICKTDAVIIHAGTNNLSDGDSVEDIVKQNKDLAETIHQINPECQIIISSILPRKNDKLANKVIEQTNQSLKQLCDSRSFAFLDSTRSFISDGDINTSLYKDNIHLNAKGGKIFGEAICDKFRDILKIPAHHSQASTGQEQSFRNGRISGRRMSDNKSNKRRNNNNPNNSRNNYPNNRGNNNMGNNNYNPNNRGNNNNPNNMGNNNNNPNNRGNKNPYNRGNNNPNNRGNNNNPNNRGNNNNNNPNNMGNNNNNNLNNIGNNNNNLNNRSNNNNPNNNSNENNYGNNNSGQSLMNNQSPMMFMPMPFFQPHWFNHNQTITSQ